MTPKNESGQIFRHFYQSIYQSFYILEDNSNLYGKRCEVPIH